MAHWHTGVWRKCGRAKLSNEEAQEIYYLYSNNLATRKELSQKYNVSKILISHIKNGRTRLHCGQKKYGVKNES